MIVRARFIVSQWITDGRRPACLVLVPYGDFDTPAEARAIATPSTRLELWIDNPGILSTLRVGEPVYLDVSAGGEA
jgi:hypothetical protein